MIKISFPASIQIFVVVFVINCEKELRIHMGPQCCQTPSERIFCESDSVNKVQETKNKYKKRNY